MGAVVVRLTIRHAIGPTRQLTKGKDTTTITQTSPFEEIRQVDENGQEFWSARDLTKAVEHEANSTDRRNRACLTGSQLPSQCL